MATQVTARSMIRSLIIVCTLCSLCWGQASVEITVNPIAPDGPSNPSNCGPTSNPNCNFRSAWDYCADTGGWLTTSVTTCNVNIAANGGSYFMDMSNPLSTINIANTIQPSVSTFSINLVGSGAGGATIASAVGALVNGQLLAVAVQSQSPNPAPKLTVSITNIHFSGFGDGTTNGGALSVIDIHTLNMNRVTIDSCNATNGGGIYIEEVYNVAISDSIFQNNNAVWYHNAGGNGGALYLSIALPETTTLSITGSTFQGNSALNGGGAYFVGARNLVVSFSEFKNNLVSVAGGGLLLDSGCDFAEVRRCTFASNSAGSQGSGGGLSFGSSSQGISMRKLTFSTNDAYSGGGLYIGASNSDFTMVNITAHENSAVIGAAATMEGNGAGFSISDSNFYNNMASDDGGALALIKGITTFMMSYTSLTSNNAGIHGGGIYIGTVMTDLSFDHIYIEKNKAEFQGGGMYMHSLVIGLVLSNSFITGNDGSYLGGGIFADQLCSSITITNVSVVGNKAPFGDGGSFFFHMRHSDITINNSTFESNIAFQNGGAGVFNLGNGRVTFTDNYVSSNSAVFNGGGIYFGSQNEQISVNGTTFWGNTATDGCGLAMADLNQDFALSGNIFEKNICGGDGGGIVVGSSNTISVIQDCNFISNVAAGHGGAISVGIDNIFVSVTNCLFDSNYAVSSQGGDGGGAIYLTSTNQMEIASSRFVDNRAIFNGGAIYSSVENILQLSHCTFSNNTLAGVSADILATKSDTVSGGAIYMDGRHTGLLFSHCAFINNAAESGKGSCGAIYVADGSRDISIVDSEFTNNTAYNNGGAMCFIGSTGVVVNRTTFTENILSNVHSDILIGGGAIYFDSVVTATVEQCAFTRNHAAFFGSALFSIDGSGITSRLNLYHENSVELCGGTVFWSFTGDLNGIDIFSDSDSFVDNSAPYGTTVATQGMQVVSLNQTIFVTEFDNYVEMDVKLVDFYGQQVTGLVLADDGSTKAIELAFSASVNDGLSGCKDGSTGSISGSTSALTETGRATFDAMVPSCNPDGYMQVAFSLLSSAYAPLISDYLIEDLANATLTFRQCVPGEYYLSQSCVVCENTTYSLALAPDYRDTVCDAAPANSNEALTYGDNIYTKAGYWRVNNMSEALIECPYGNIACLGGYETGPASCDVGYEGPLCAVCSSNYYYDGTLKTCTTCTGQDMSIFAVIVIPTVFIFIFIVFYLARKLRPEIFIRVMHAAGAVSNSMSGGNSDGDGGDDDDDDDSTGTDDKNSDGYFKKLYKKAKKSQMLTMLSRNTASLTDKIISKVKILMSAFQIVSGLPATLKISFPSAVTKLLDGLSFANIFSVNTSAFTCLSAKRYDYVDTLQFATVLPVVITAILYIMYAIEVQIVWHHARRQNLLVTRSMEEGSRKESSQKVKVNNDEAHDKIKGLTGHYVSLFLLLTYTVLTSVSSTIAGAIPCIQIDPDNVDSTMGNKYLIADLSIDCSSDRYWFGYSWACITALIYPIGIPVMYYWLLSTNKQDILNRDINHANEELRKMNLAKKLARSSSGKITTIDKALIEDQICDVGDAPHVHEEIAKLVADAGHKVVDAVDKAAKDLIGGRDRDGKDLYAPGPDSSNHSATHDGVVDIGNDIGRNRNGAAGDIEIISVGTPEKSAPAFQEPSEIDVPARPILKSGNTETGSGYVGNTDYMGHKSEVDQQEDVEGNNMKVGEDKNIVLNVLPPPTHMNTINAYHLQFLHKAYEPKFWYWEIVETMRRLFFTALLVIATTGENLQIVGSIIMAVIFMKLYGFFQPYQDDADDYLQEAAQYQVFFTLFGGLIMRTDALKGVPHISQYISAFIIFVNTLTMAMTPFLVSYVMRCDML